MTTGTPRAPGIFGRFGDEVDLRSYLRLAKVFRRERPDDQTPAVQTLGVR